MMYNKQTTHHVIDDSCRVNITPLSSFDRNEYGDEWCNLYLLEIISPLRIDAADLVRNFFGSNHGNPTGQAFSEHGRIWAIPQSNTYTDTDFYIVSVEGGLDI